MAFALLPAKSMACDRAPELKALHDAFRAIESPTNASERRRAAQTLAETIRQTDVLGLASRLNADGIPVDTARLARDFSHGADIAHATLTGADLAGSLQSARHAERTAHAAGVLRRAGCSQNLEPKSAIDISQAGNGMADDGDVVRSEAPGRPMSDGLSLPLQTVLLLAGLLGLAGISFWLWRRSLRFRAAQVDRLPRHPVHVIVGVEFEDPLLPPATATSVDISLGGMKLSNSDKLPPGTRLLVDTGIEGPAQTIGATVVWSNPHYCGIVFDQMLSEDDIILIQNRLNPDGSPQVTM